MALLQIEAANTVLYCEKWAETVAFYRETLALPVLFENEWFVEFALTESARFSIANAARATIDAVAGQGVTIAMQVADVFVAREKLVEGGVEIGRIKSRFNAQVCYFYDPEGHRLELWSQGTGQRRGFISCV